MPTKGVNQLTRLPKLGKIKQGIKHENENESESDTVYLSPTANLLSIQEER